MSKVLQHARPLLVVGQTRKYGRGERTAGNLVGYLLLGCEYMLTLKIIGYDKALAPVQVLPRKVSSIVKPVRAIVMTVRWKFYMVLE